MLVVDDRYRGGAPGNHAEILRDIIKGDTHRNPLGQAHPTEGRVDVGQQVVATGAVAVFDAGDDAFHMAAQPRVVADHPDVDALADMDAVELGFFEIAVDMERIAVHDRQHRPPGTDELLCARRTVVDVAVHGAADHRAVEVQLRAVYSDLRFHQRHLGAGYP
ncbi:hypothetical protein D3C84_880370 [compost metagenome]